MLRWCAAVCILLVPSACAQPDGIAPPRIGYIRDGLSWLRPLYGAGHTFVTGNPIQKGALSMACSGSVALVKTQDSILALEEGKIAGAWPVPPGPALFAFSKDGMPALAFFPRSSELLRFDAEDIKFIPVPTIAGEVLSIAAQPDGAIAIALVEEGARWIQVWPVLGHTLESQHFIAPGLGPALVLPDGMVIFGEGTELIIRRGDAPDRRLPLDAPAVALDQIGWNWFEVRLEDGSRYLLKLALEKEELMRLPEPSLELFLETSPEALGEDSL